MRRTVSSCIAVVAMSVAAFAQAQVSAFAADSPGADPGSDGSTVGSAAAAAGLATAVSLSASPSAPAAVSPSASPSGAAGQGSSSSASSSASSSSSAQLLLPPSVTIPVPPASSSSSASSSSAAASGSAGSASLPSLLQLGAQQPEGGAQCPYPALVEVLTDCGVSPGGSTASAGPQQPFGHACSPSLIDVLSQCDVVPGGGPEMLPLAQVGTQERANSGVPCREALVQVLTQCEATLLPGQERIQPGALLKALSQDQVRVLTATPTQRAQSTPPQVSAPPQVGVPPQVSTPPQVSAPSPATPRAAGRVSRVAGGVAAAGAMIPALPQTGADLAALTAAGIVLCVAG